MNRTPCRSDEAALFHVAWFAADGFRVTGRLLESLPSMSRQLRPTRREFLHAGLAAGAFALAPQQTGRARTGRTVALVADASDAVAASTQAQWAMGELQRALESAGAFVRRLPRVDAVAAQDLCVVAAGAASRGAAQTMVRAVVPTAPEGLAIAVGRVSGRDVMLAGGADVRGLVYALLELADRVRAGVAPEVALAAAKPIAESPANRVRSVMRQFTSETFDKPWFVDREGWRAYLSMLATHRFNRLHLGFGLGYDALQGVTDSYLLFLYPFLLDVPGHRVRVTNLADADRDANLELLRFISDETVARGLEFQLGVWMHGYQLTASPRAKYIVEGLDAATHADYCHDALAAVLRACPSISAVALRIHGESGIAEGSYDFWQRVFEGVAASGRRIEIDLHAKGLDQTMVERAIGTGMPVNVSPKYWAEHLGLPYHQAAIRDLEMPVAGRTGAGLMTISEGARSFTRYGYADFLRDDRRYTVRHRVFAGTQRLLASGDPEGAAAHARAFQFCGSTGFDLMEPLTARGRRGTADAGRRSGYARSRQLEPRWDWEKFTYWYRTWGRLTYNPETPAEVCARDFSGERARSVLASNLAHVSRVLPLVTTAYLPSAACDAYWPEVYWNQPMVEEPRPNPYGDTPAPRTFQHASPLDPQIFSGMDEHARELLEGSPSGKYSPIEVAQRLEDEVAAASINSGRAGELSQNGSRITYDVAILAGLGRFFGAKVRAGVLYAIHERTGDARALDEALAAYRRARTAWADLVASAADVYGADLSASDRLSERGAWADRLPAIDADIAAMAARRTDAVASSNTRVDAAIVAATGRPARPLANCTHSQPAGFRPGAAVTLSATFPTGALPDSARLYYRHVNQAERWESVALSARGRTVTADIPAAYTDSPFPLQYYFAFAWATGRAWIYPGLGPDLRQSPYVVLRRS